MTDTTLLAKYLEESGVTITHLAKRLGCTRNRVYSILHGADVTASEIVVICDTLHISKKDRDKIFFATYGYSQ